MAFHIRKSASPNLSDLMNDHEGLAVDVHDDAV